MRIIRQETSTNGRWGLTIVGDVADDFRFPAKGVLTDMGTIEGHRTFKFAADENGRWVDVASDVKLLAGCAEVCSMSLQSGDRATLLVGGDFFAYISYGYKRRSQTVVAYSHGKTVNLPAAVMAAMGLITCTTEVVQVEPPPVESPIADALKRAGII